MPARLTGSKMTRDASGTSRSIVYCVSAGSMSLQNTAAASSGVERAVGRRVSTGLLGEGANAGIERVEDTRAVGRNRGGHEHDVAQPIRHRADDARQRHPRERMTDEHDIVQIVAHDLVDDGGDEIRDRDRREIGRPLPAPREVHRDDRTGEMRREQIPARCPEAAPVHQHVHHGSILTRNTIASISIDFVQ